MRRTGHAALLAFTLAAVAAVAQEPARPLFLVLNQERLLTGSQRGQALLAEEEAARDRLRAEAGKIETALEEEERQLTERRPGMDAAAFRALADDFDARVVAARRDQDARASALALEFDQKRRQFYADVAPVLVGVMEERGAQAILDESSVLIADQTLNITDAVIAAIDGPRAQPDAPAPQAPDAGTAPGAD